jgi:hypothetical protein
MLCFRQLVIANPVTPSSQSQKETAWKAALLALEQLTDRTGKGLDAGIKESVAALMAHGFPTIQSCEGHLDWGLPYPWIEIRAPAPNGWRNDHQKEQWWRRENLIYQQKMLVLLSEFYRHRRLPFDAQLSLAAQGFGGFRLCSAGAEILTLLSLDERKSKLRLYQKEMSDFTAFLKKKGFTDD